MLKRFALGMLLIATLALGAGIKDKDDEGHWVGSALHQSATA